PRLEARVLIAEVRRKVMRSVDRVLDEAGAFVSLYEVHPCSAVMRPPRSRLHPCLIVIKHVDREVIGKDRAGGAPDYDRRHDVLEDIVLDKKVAGLPRLDAVTQGLCIPCPVE